MKSINNIIAEIRTGKNIEENLSRFAKELAELYYESALLNLTMTDYTLCEMLEEREEKVEDKVQVLIDSIHNILNEYLSKESNGLIREGSIQELDRYRGNIEAKMQILTNYMDILQNYEYILNRIELRYVPDSYEETEENGVQEIIRYLFQEKDNVVVNGRIKEALGQLPVRMARGRFFELIENSFTIYKEADSGSIDSYLYILKTSAMLGSSEEMKKEFPMLHQIRNSLEQADYKNLTKEQYFVLTEQLHLGAEYIRDMVDIYITLVDVVNKLYVVLLTSPYIMSLESKEEKVCKEILQELNKSLIEKDDKVNLVNLIPKLEETEGKQEKIVIIISQYEGMLSEILESYQDIIPSIMLDKIYQGLAVSQVLMSSSYFAQIDGNRQKPNLDKGYLEKVSKEFLLELRESFQNRNQMINRAVMANIMSKLPVFFKDTEEVMEYVAEVLEQCNDNAEKLASIHIIKELAQDN